MPSALLVCGSRSLTRDPEATAWAKGEIEARVRALDPATSRVISGGAPGPDRWCKEAVFALRAEGIGLDLTEYLANGKRVYWQPQGAGRQVAHHGRETRWHGGDPGPLARNAFMIDGLVRLRVVGVESVVLGLVDATSATRGTDHTLRLARAAGLTVERLVWEGRAR